MLELANDLYRVRLEDHSDDPEDASELPVDKTYIIGKKEPYASSACYKVVVEGADPVYSCLLLGTGGPTRLDSQSAILRDDQCLIGISSYLVALQMPDLDMLWYTEADFAGVFGVYLTPKYASYITHGELEIARISYSGELIWKTSGRDIFTNGFILFADYIEAIDFNDDRYRIDLATGANELLGR